MPTITFCMTDNSGRPVDRPIPHMQSDEALRDMIRRGDRTVECWGVMKANAERVRVGMAVIAKMKASK